MHSIVRGHPHTSGCRQHLARLFFSSTTIFEKSQRFKSKEQEDRQLHKPQILISPSLSVADRLMLQNPPKGTPKKPILFFKVASYATRAKQPQSLRRKKQQCTET
jgi:hypothetical protein